MKKFTLSALSIFLLVPILGFTAALYEELEVDLKAMRPAQWRVSLKNVKKKVEKIEKGDGERKIEGGVFSRKKELPIMRTTTGELFLIDGHHELLAALRLGATKAKVQLYDRDKAVDSAEALERDQKSYTGMALRFYLWDVEGDGFVWKAPLASLALLDDPAREDWNRYLFGKTKIEREEGKEDKLPKGKSYALWVKVTGAVPPFAEFILGDILRAFGLITEKKSHKDFETVLQAWEFLTSAKDGKKPAGKPQHPFSWDGLNLDWLVLADKPVERAGK